MSEQKTVWVTGASSGLGLHTAKALREDGWQVIAGARSFSEGKGEDGIIRLTLDVTDDGARAAPKTAGTVSETAAKGAKKTAGRRGISPKSLQIRNGVRLLKSNVENVIRNIDTINDAMSRSGDGGTMKALEEAVRERLGLVWMRRGRRWGRAA